MNLRQAAEMALSALETARCYVYQMDALRAVLAEADEPVAWRYKKDGSDKWHVSAMTPEEIREWNDIVAEEPLYTHPSRHEPLTEKQIGVVQRQLASTHAVNLTLGECRVVARAIERAHGIGGDE